MIPTLIYGPTLYKKNFIKNKLAMETTQNLSTVW